MTDLKAPRSEATVRSTLKKKASLSPQVWGSAIPNRAEQHARKREMLIHQAARAFRRKGFHATSMEDIASTLGVTKGALYRYIRNKHEVLFECFKIAQHLSDDALETALKQAGTGLDQLRIFMYQFIEQFISRGIAGTVMSDLSALLPAHRKEIVRGRDTVDRTLRKIIARGVSDGSIKPCNPKLAVFTIMGAVNWIPTWYSPAGEFDSSRIADLMTNLFINGLDAGLSSPDKR